MWLFEIARYKNSHYSSHHYCCRLATTIEAVPSSSRHLQEVGVSPHLVQQKLELGADPIPSVFPITGVSRTLPVVRHGSWDTKNISPFGGGSGCLATNGRGELQFPARSSPLIHRSGEEVQYYGYYMVPNYVQDFRAVSSVLRNLHAFVLQYSPVHVAPSPFSRGRVLVLQKVLEAARFLRILARPTPSVMLARPTDFPTARLPRVGFGCENCPRLHSPATD